MYSVLFRKVEFAGLKASLPLVCILNAQHLAVFATHIIWDECHEQIATVD